jgi:hypothetical protein
MVVRMMNPLEIEIKKTVFAHLPAVGDLGILSRGDLATVLHTACTEAALAGWARGAETTQKRVDAEMAILRQELKSIQTELAYAKAN